MRKDDLKAIWMCIACKLVFFTVMLITIRLQGHIMIEIVIMLSPIEASAWTVAYDRKYLAKY